MHRFYGKGEPKDESNPEGISAAQSKALGKFRQVFSHLANSLDDPKEPIYDIRYMERPGKDPVLILKRAAEARPEIMFVYGPDLLHCLAKANGLLLAGVWRPDKFRINDLLEKGVIDEIEHAFMLES